MVAVSLSFVAKALQYKAHIIIIGRIIAIWFQFRSGSMIVIDVHLTPGLTHDEYRKYVEAIAKYVNNFPTTPVIIMGDFNFVDADEGRVDLETGAIKPSNGWRSDVFRDAQRGIAREARDPAEYLRTVPGIIPVLIWSGFDELQVIVCSFYRNMYIWVSFFVS